jgi:predicted MPP superfamily phosphohydrolase
LIFSREYFCYAAISAIFVYVHNRLKNCKNHYLYIQIQQDFNIPQYSNAVFISDSHLGNIVNNSRLKGIVDKINALNPDIVFLGGDLIDDNIEPYIEQNMAETFKKINSRYGVYAVLGNHEH